MLTVAVGAAMANPHCPTLQAFFTERLFRQRRASGHTIAAYRDTILLLLIFASTQTAKQAGSTSPTWVRRWSPRSQIIWSAGAAIVSAPATPDWRDPLPIHVIRYGYPVTP